VCRLSGAQEKTGFRATSLETLRQMVAAGVGVTLLPALSVHDPIVQPAGIRLVRFADPAAQPPDRAGLAQVLGAGRLPAAACGGDRHAGTGTIGAGLKAATARGNG